MALFQVLYMSSLTESGADALPAILATCVSNNQKKGITGMMLHADGDILQVLEGEREAVVQLFRQIQKDTRHSGIFVLLEEEIAQRQFASWSMGFKHATSAELAKFPDAARVFRVQKDTLEQRVQSSAALAVLQSFAQGSMPIV